MTVYTYKWGILLAVNHLDRVLHNVLVPVCDCGNESEATELFSCCIVVHFSCANEIVFEVTLKC